MLTGAESPACGMLMLHKSENRGGMTSMDMVSSVNVPAGGGVTFAPGGFHLMCTEPKSNLKPGATVPVTLLFQDGSKITTDFAVRNAADGRDLIIAFQQRPSGAMSALGQKQPLDSN